MALLTVGARWASWPSVLDVASSGCRSRLPVAAVSPGRQPRGLLRSRCHWVLPSVPTSALAVAQFRPPVPAVGSGCLYWWSGKPVSPGYHAILAISNGRRSPPSVPPIRPGKSLADGIFRLLVLAVTQFRLLVHGIGPGWQSLPAANQTRISPGCRSRRLFPATGSACPFRALVLGCRLWLSIPAVTRPCAGLDFGTDLGSELAVSTG